MYWTKKDTIAQLSNELLWKIGIMGFRKESLANTNFYELVADIDIEACRIPEKNRKSRFAWPCAYNSEMDVVFTQLMSNNNEMKDFEYYYLLFIGEDPIFIYWTLEYTKFLDKGGLCKYDLEYLVGLVNEASIVITANNEPLFRNSKF